MVLGMGAVLLPHRKFFKVVNHVEFLSLTESEDSVSRVFWVRVLEV